MTNVYKIPDVNNLKPQLIDSSFYCDVRFDGETYIGLHLVNGAATSSSDWKILKLSSTRIQTVYGAWDDRVSLF